MSIHANGRLTARRGLTRDAIRLALPRYAYRPATSPTGSGGLERVDIDAVHEPAFAYREESIPRDRRLR